MNDEPARRFPDMWPVASPPAVGHAYGTGTRMAGRRDDDEETGTYVKTHCFCVLFVPVVALGAYRVADAPNGWYCLGRVPLSGLARRWNLFVLVAALTAAGYGGWRAYTGTADYKAAARLADADRLAAAGDPAEAAVALRDVIAGGTRHAAAARERFAALLADPDLPAGPAAGAFRVAADLARRNKLDAPDLFARGLALAEC